MMVYDGMTFDMDNHILSEFYVFSCEIILFENNRDIHMSALRHLKDDESYPHHHCILDVLIAEFFFFKPYNIICEHEQDIYQLYTHIITSFNKTFCQCFF